MNKKIVMLSVALLIVQSSFVMGMDAHHVWSKLNVLTDKFPSDEIFSAARLNMFREQDWVTSRDVAINYVEDKNDFSKFNFHEYGFTPISNVISSQLSGLSGLRDDVERNDDVIAVEQELQGRLLAWSKSAGIDCDLVIMGGWVKRNLSSTSSLTRSYAFAHADFPENKTEESIKAVGGEAMWNAFSDFDIVQIVNVWMPLNDEANGNTLALMNKATHKSSRVVTTEAYFERELKFKSVYLDEAQPLEDNWFAFKIARNDGIIFDSERTFHSAVDIAGRDLSCEPRQSIEYRAFLVKMKVH